MEGRAGAARFWGWCHLGAGETSFDEVRLTDCTGMGEPRAEIDVGAMVLGPVLFEVPDGGRWAPVPGEGPRPGPASMGPREHLSVALASMGRADVVAAALEGLDAPGAEAVLESAVGKGP